MNWRTLARVLFAVAVASTAFLEQPLPIGPIGNVAFALAMAALVVWFEVQLRVISLARVSGALVGGAIGWLVALAISQTVFSGATGHHGLHFIEILIMLVMPYLGLVLGGTWGEWLEPSRLVGLFRATGPERRHRILDTSVIIDGRIAEVCEAGFLDGTLVVPQFVLKELQHVADSSDSMRRNRGRRGLDILQRMQKIAGVEVVISDTDFPDLRDVDLKLIELARTLQGKIVTNDFNLNKVAQLRGVEVLNVNELANSLKAVVLPGETMKVFILKEGKEANQGVAYVEDGTMVVVDNARQAIGRTIDIVVTSMLQTTAGKMIFGRCIEAGPAASAPPVERDRETDSRRVRQTQG